MAFNAHSPIIAFLVLLTSFASISDAEIKESSASGFRLRISLELECDSTTAYKRFVEDFSKWYDASHSYSQDSDNLSLDLEKGCMLEILPEGGFVRHMEIVFHQPGKVFRMTGGLGPLQGMGVSGTMTFSFVDDADDEGKCVVIMEYNVCGADHSELDKIAGPVDQVLSDQLKRFQNHCHEKE